MTTKYYTVAIIIIIYLTTVFAQCKKGCIRNSYSFEITSKAYPNLDSVNIGDTIWLEIDVPTNLKDAITGNNINYSGAVNLSSNLSFQKYVSGNFIDAVSGFNFKIINGIDIGATIPTLFKEYRFIEELGRYKFKLAIIPNTLGTYRIVYGNAQNVYTDSEPCSKAGFVFNFESSVNLHRYLVGYTGPPVVGGDYYFKVK
jgi:hypothetical protein